MCRPSAPDVFAHAGRAQRVELVANPARDVEHVRERHAVRRIEIERGVVGELRMRDAREPRILRDGRQLRHVEQRLQAAADDLRPLFDDADDFGADAGRHLGRAVLVERRAGDAVREALHHERTIGHGRQDERRDARVVAHQIALGQLQLRPEQLVQVGDLQRVAVGQGQHAILPRSLQCRQLIDARSTFVVRRSAFFVRRSGSRFASVGRVCARRRLAERRTSNAERRTSAFRSRVTVRPPSCHREVRGRPDAAACRRRSTR